MIASCISYSVIVCREVFSNQTTQYYTHMYWLANDLTFHSPEGLCNTPKEYVSIESYDKSSLGLCRPLCLVVICVFDTVSILCLSAVFISTEDMIV